MAVTRTPILKNPGVVKVSTSSGEYLHFTLEAGGPVPGFSFSSSEKGVLFQNKDFLPNDPASRYEWDHLRNPSDIQQFEMLELFMLFLTNADYTYTVDLCSSSGSSTTVLQVKYNGTPDDFTKESFTVVIA